MPKFATAVCPPLYWAPIAPSCSLNSLMPSDRKSTRLNSSHTVISYAVFCLKKKKKTDHEKKILYQHEKRRVVVRAAALVDLDRPQPASFDGGHTTLSPSRTLLPYTASRTPI